MNSVSQLELMKVGGRFLEFIVDGVPVLERFPLRDFDDVSETGEFDEAVARIFQKGFFVSRLGIGSADWQRKALRQLLLLDPPELPCGRRRLYTCLLCDCAHFACRIRQSGGCFVWEDFVRGSPTGENAMETDVDGEWKRVQCAPIAAPAKEFKMHSEPILFAENSYRALFEPMLSKLDCG